MTYSMRSYVDSGYGNMARLYINEDLVTGSEHGTYSISGGQVTSNGGRQVTREVFQGDNIELRTSSTLLSGSSGYFSINFCAEYLPKM